ncbi:MAG: restriction endonuclease [Candidatus Bathyarchaeota archaeon]|nr:MAG: restriction endonuclease [Candidatus Bathyarchaeota archaeon]
MTVKRERSLLLVSKADGTRQPFDRKKVIRTCLRMGASRTQAEEVAWKIEQRIHDGTPTKKILQMIFRYLRKHRPAVRYLICLRRGLSLMKSKPDFERYVQKLLTAHGYKVSPSQTIQGKCVEHEVDAIAEKDGKTFLVEVKHHLNYHTPTGLDEGRIIRAVFEDVVDGYQAGHNHLKVDNAMMVCNTKLSWHAKRYTDCKGIEKIGWSTPRNRSLQDLIEEKRLYPIHCLRSLTRSTREALASAGILLLQDLATRDPKNLFKQAKIERLRLNSLIREASTILEIR